MLGGQIAKMRDLVEKVSEISGRKPPKRELPVAAMKMAIPIGPLVGKAMGFPPNLRELIRTSDGVTYWATDDKARRELGYAPRDMDTGLRQTLRAELRRTECTTQTCPAASRRSRAPRPASARPRR